MQLSGGQFGSRVLTRYDLSLSKICILHLVAVTRTRAGRTASAASQALSPLSRCFESSPAAVASRLYILGNCKISFSAVPSSSSNSYCSSSGTWWLTYSNMKKARTMQYPSACLFMTALFGLVITSSPWAWNSRVCPISSKLAFAAHVKHAHKGIGTLADECLEESWTGCLSCSSKLSLWTGI